jgi:hypothetical protein
VTRYTSSSCDHEQLKHDKTVTDVEKLCRSFFHFRTSSQECELRAEHASRKLFRPPASAYTAPMKQCIFCNRPAGATLQTWPKWILDRRRRSAFRLRVSHPPYIVGTICKTCSNGWMKELERGTMRILAPIFDDIPVLLGIDEQQTLTGWIMKLAFVFDSIKGDSHFYEREDCVAFKKMLSVPQLTRIWIGRASSGNSHITETEFTRPYEAGVLKGMATTLRIEHFVAQIVSLRLPQVVTMPHKVTVYPTRGDWDRFLTPIWPHKESVVTWPSQASFHGAGLISYDGLQTRWELSGDTPDPNLTAVFSVNEARSSLTF